MVDVALPWVEPEDFVVAHLAGRDRAFWLDGSGARAWSGRMSYVGWLDDGELSLTQRADGLVQLHSAGRAEAGGDDIFTELERLTPPHVPPSMPYATAGWVGFLGYGARRDLPALEDKHGVALHSCWLRASRYVAFDHARRRVVALAADDRLDAWAVEVRRLIATTSPASAPIDPATARVESSYGRGDFDRAFRAVQEQLRLGNSYEVNLTFRSAVESRDAPLETYRRLRRLSPAPYAAFVTHGGTSLLSASPERFVTVDADRRVETRPIKGTTAREPDPERDVVAAERLRAEPKFAAENLMIVDLLRNDLSRVCQVGSVEVPDLMHVESYPAVHQLVTTITGRLRPEVSTVGAVHALFPGGSMTGAPKERTMRIISEVETTPRGVYSGAVGWFLDDGRADLGIVIRSLVHRDGRYVFGTGGGITVYSVPDEEYAETTWKAHNLLRALGL